MSEPTGKPRLSAALAALKNTAASAEQPRDSFARLSDKLEGRRSSRLRYGWWMVAACGVTAAVVAAVTVWHAQRPSTVGGFELVSASPDWRWRGAGDGDVEIEAGEATLRARDVDTTLVATRGTHLRREPSGVRVLFGTASFSVEPRRATSPVRVLVSHGAIEVMGTRFTVVQGEAGGSVRLDSGAIRFVPTNGESVMVQPGESLRWPLLAPQESPFDQSPADRAPQSHRALSSSRATKPFPEPAAASQPAAEQKLLYELEAMQIRREYESLAARIEQLLATRVPEPLRERLSFELCDVLVRHGNDRGRACAQVAEHLRRYAGGEYTASLRKAQQVLGCASEQPER